MTAHIAPETISKPMAVLDRKSLAYAVTLAAMTVERRNTIPILSNLLITGNGEALAVTGDNLDSRVTVTVPAAADSRLAVTIPAHKAKDILAKAKASDMAALDQADESAGLDMGGIRFTMQTLPAEDFPAWEKIEAPVGVTVDMAAFLHGLDRTRFAQSSEEKRYYLNGAYLHLIRPYSGARPHLRVVATDGHRMAWYDMTGVNPPSKMWGKRLHNGRGHGSPGVIIPRSSVDLLLKVAAAMRKAGTLPNTIEIVVSVKSAVFALGNVEVVTKLVDGTFPDYQRIIPRAYIPDERKAVMSVKALDSAVEQVGLIQDGRAGKVCFDFGPGAASLSARCPDTGTAETSVPAEWQGSPLTIGFNSRYVRDVLAEISGESVTFTMSDGSNPALISDPADSSFGAVLMPMRV